MVLLPAVIKDDFNSKSLAGIFASNEPDTSSQSMST